MQTGKEHTTSRGREARERERRDEDCRCSCREKFSEDEKISIFTNFNKIHSHELQNMYLRGCIKKVTKRRQTDEQEFEAREHTIELPRGTLEVCQKWFLGVHGIKRARIMRKVHTFIQNISNYRVI